MLFRSRGIDKEWFVKNGIGRNHNFKTTGIPYARAMFGHAAETNFHPKDFSFPFSDTHAEAFGGYLFHATNIASLGPIFEQGITRRGRVAPMLSPFIHYDPEGRADKTQRAKDTRMNAIIVFDGPTLVHEYNQPGNGQVYIDCAGTVSVVSNSPLCLKTFCTRILLLEQGSSRPTCPVFSSKFKNCLPVAVIAHEHANIAPRDAATALRANVAKIGRAHV